MNQDTLWGQNSFISAESENFFPIFYEIQAEMEGDVVIMWLLSLEDYVSYIRSYHVNQRLINSRAKLLFELSPAANKVAVLVIGIRDDLELIDFKRKFCF